MGGISYTMRIHLFLFAAIGHTSFHIDKEQRFYGRSCGQCQSRGFGSIVIMPVAKVGSFSIEKFVLDYELSESGSTQTTGNGDNATGFADSVESLSHHTTKRGTDNGMKVIDADD